MKFLFTILFFLPLVCFSQIALVDVKLSKPIQYVNQIPADISKQGLVPVYKNEIDSVITILQTMKSLFVRGKRVESEYFHYATEHTIFNVRRYRYPENDVYSIIMTSKDDPLGSGMVISNKRNDYKVTLKFINKFIAYLHNGKS